MTLRIDGTGLAIEHVVDVARHAGKIELTQGAEERIRTCREMVEGNESNDDEYV